MATALDHAGNTVVVGSFFKTVTFGSVQLQSEGERDIFVARLSPTGVWVQATRAGGLGRDLAFSVAVDADDNVVVAGSFGGYPGYSIPGYSTDSPTANFGNVKLTSSGGSDIFVARLTPVGNWQQVIRAGGKSDDGAFALALDATGTAYIGGYLSPSVVGFGSTTVNNNADFSNGFVARLSPMGTWSQVAQLSGAGSGYVSSLALGTNGTVIAAGSFQGPTLLAGSTTLVNADPTTNGTSDVFVSQLNSDGIWTRASRAGGAGYDFADAVAVAPNGQIVVTGNFASSTAIFGNFSLFNANTSPSPTSPYIYDIYVARLSPTNEWIQAVSAGGIGNDQVNALALDAVGNSVIAGHFARTAAFGSLSLTSKGSDDIFVATLGATGTWLRAVQAGGNDQDNATSLLRNGNTLIVGGYLASFASQFDSIAVSVFRPTGFIAQLGSLPLATISPKSTIIFEAAPNPTGGSSTLIITAANATRSVQLLDELGREIRKYIIPAHTSSMLLDLVGVPNGLYLLHCETATRRLIVYQ